MAEVKLVISGDPAAIKRAVAESAVAMDTLQRSGEALTTSTAKSTAAADRYIEALKREAIALGAGEEALRRYDMAQLGLSQKAQQQAEAIHRAVDAHKEAEKAADAHGASMERLGKHLGNMINIAATAAAAMAGVITGQIIQKTIEAEQSHLRLQATLNATGYAAGKTREQIEKLVAEMSKKTFFDDEKIREAATALLRFKDISGESFDLALRLSADLAASMGTDMVIAARQLGSALEDPERGLRMLADAGRNLSSVQRGVIKDLIESGQHAKALQIMLDEVNGTVGGTAETMNTGMKAATVGLDKAWDDLLKTLGKSEAVGGTLIWVFGAMVDTLRDIDDLLSRGLGDQIARIAGYGLHLAGGAMKFLGFRGGQVLQDQAARLGGSTYGAQPGNESNPGEALTAEILALTGRERREEQRALEVASAARKKAADEAAKLAEQAAKAYAQVTKAAEQYVSALEHEAAILGMTNSQRKLYEAALVASTLKTEKERAALMARAETAIELLRLDEERIAQEKRAQESAKEGEKVLNDYNKGLDRQVTALERELEGLERTNEQYGLSKTAIEELTLAKLEQNLATWDAETASDAERTALEKMVNLQRQIVEQARKGEGMRAQTNELKEQERLWVQIAGAAGDFFSDLVMNGRSAFDNLKNYLRRFLAELIQVFATRWILQLGASAMGGGGGGGIGGALASAAGSYGSNSLMGAVGSAAGSWLGSTAVGQFWGGMTGSIVGPTQSGTALAYGQQAGATIAQYLPYLQWIAVAVAALAASAHLWSTGWRGQTANTMPGAWEGGSVESNISRTAARIARAFGLSDRDAATWAGVPIVARTWGFSEPHQDAYGVRGSVGARGVTGQNWQDWSQRAGWLNFEGDIRETDESPLSREQQRFLDNMMSGVTRIVDMLGDRYGVTPGSALAGYSRDFDLQLSNNGDPLTEEELTRLFGDFFAGVLQDQVALMLAAGGQGALADYVRQLEGSGEEITRGVQNVLNYLDALTQLDDMIAALEGGPIVALTQQLDAMKDRVDKGFEELDAAVNEGDIERTVSAEQDLLAAIVERYQTEIAMVRQLQAAIDSLQQEAYQFALSIAGRINAVGGSRDIGAIALGRAGVLRGTIGGDSNPGRQLGNLGQYVGAIDTWYNSRRSDIERDIQAQAANAQAASAAQQAVYQARISALQTELDLTQQWAGVLDRAGQMMDRMRFTGLNPLHALGRLDLAQGASEEAGAAFRAAAGGERATAANRYLDALQRELELLPEALQRPSPEYQARYNAIIAQLAEVEGEARTGEERALALQQQMNLLQGEANAIATATFDVNAAMNAAMEGLNREALGYYTYAEEEGQRLYALQIQQHEEQLQAITGGMDVELFIAQVNQQQLAELRRVRDLLDALPERLGALLSGSGSPAPGTGNGEGDGEDSEDSVKRLDVVIQIPSGEVLKIIRVNLTDLMREGAVS